MKDRIQAIIDSKRMSQAQFADAIGVQRSTLHHILSGRNNPSLEVISKIHNAYPEINLDWIFTGHSEMLIDGAAVDSRQEGGLFALENGIFQTTDGVVAGKPGHTEDHTTAKGTLPVSKSVGSERRITKIIVVYSDGTTESLS